MATKKTAKAKPGRKSKPDLADRIADAALEFAAREGWASLSVPKVADALSEPLGRVIGVYPTTGRIASALLSRIDEHVLSQVQDIDDSETPRDRLFEILMIRFDALQRHRSGYEALIRGLSRRPASILKRAPALVHSMALMLIASGIDASSPFGMIRAHALTIAYGAVLRTWLADDSDDMAKTMSALDQALDRLERMQSLILDRRPSDNQVNDEDAD
ncbi:MAG: hypothetical protein HN793_11825 [Rhodospirillaceae bacterium]|jgi:hypothetical protein|nr:hypothetical protein [Rhodospirillaceae bacterium]MBT5241139.1 hypothetical protein [Rhodospirillaceae bacterium]MBT5565651.1 hypothetical protein [Rhodospirillaceae bacterium]MBT6090857.1 hypothetical protein [Rhodospirillaceae bacterium]MBT7451511.1 hypothetical protein [Rhodospirillaceae bacterium]